MTGFPVVAALLIAIGVVLATIASSGARAQSVVSPQPVIALDGPVPATELAGAIDAALDPDWSWTVDEVAAGERDGAFTRVAEDTPSFGYTKSRVWLRLRVRNAIEATDAWRILFNENFLQSVVVYLVRGDGTVDVLLRQDVDSPFATRPVPFSRLVAPMTLAPGEEATLLVSYWSGGLSATRLGFETAADFAALAATSNAKNFGFYGMSFVLVVVGLIALTMARNPVFFAYAGYTLATLLYLMNADGAAFRYLWPGAPWFNDYASIVAGSSLFALAFLFGQTFLETRTRHPMLHAAFTAGIAFCAACILASPFVDRQLIKQVLVNVSPAFALLMVASGLIAARTRFREVRFYLLAWVGATLAALLNMSRHLLGLDLSREFQYDSTRLWLVLDALLMGLAIADRINQQRRAAERATERSLADARRNLRLNERLRELETDYDHALENARRQGERIHDTVHDLRQPLNALRLSLRDLARSEDGRGPPLEAVETSFAYMEGLVAEQLVGGVRGGGPGGVVERPLDGRGTPDDTVDLGGILNAAREMFGLEADRKGVRFDVVPTSATTPVPSLVVMRSVSNLVSNAIKFTPPGGRVLMGVRRAGDRLRLEVHDTGSGLDATQFTLARERGHRLGNAGAVEGDGLGLSTVAALAVRHGFDVRALTTGRACGASVALDLPRGPCDGIDQQEDVGPCDGIGTSSPPGTRRSRRPEGGGRAPGLPGSPRTRPSARRTRFGVSPGLRRRAGPVRFRPFQLLQGVFAMGWADRMRGDRASGRGSRHCPATSVPQGTNVPRGKSVPHGATAAIRAAFLVGSQALVLLTLLLIVATPARAQEASRHALVIGNGEYRTVSRLKNPANDARAVSAALMAAQFEVTTVIDGTRREMDRAIHELMSSIEAGGVGLFYFAGHGVQVGGQNYLIPIDDERIQSQSDLKYEAVNASALVDAMRLAGNPLNIVIMDACRNNPLPAESRSASTGLGRMETGSGMFVSFATSPGAVALDGKGGNSPYSENLVEALATPGLSIEAVFKQTLRGTHDDTGGKQVPWISSSFFGEFAFLPGEAVTDEVEMVALDTGEIEVPVIEPVAEDGGVVAADEDAVAAILASLPGLYRVEGTNPDGSAYEGTVTVAALSDERLGLEWRTGGETLYDEGWIDGRWLTLGDEAEGTRAVYTLEVDGSIEGTFDETGTERIAPVARPFADGVPTGSYAMTGEYRNGDAIDGTVEIAALTDGEDGFGVIFDWNGDAYEGTAVTQGGLLAIEWDDGTVLTFGRGADGALVGLSSDLGYRIELQPGEAAPDAPGDTVASMEDLVGIYAMGGNFASGGSITGTVAIYPVGEKYMFMHQSRGMRHGNTAEIENGRLVVRWESGTDAFDLVRTASLEQVVSGTNYATMTLDRVAGPIADPSRLGLFELTRGGAEGEARTIRVGAIDVDQGKKLVVPSEVTWSSSQGNIVQLMMEGESWLFGEDADGALVGFVSSAAGEATAAVERIARPHDGTMPTPGIYALAVAGEVRTLLVGEGDGGTDYRTHARSGEEMSGRLRPVGGALTLHGEAGTQGWFWSTEDGALTGLDDAGEAALIVSVAGPAADLAAYEGLYVEFLDVGKGPVRTGYISAIIVSEDGVRYEGAVSDGTMALAPVTRVLGALRLGGVEFRIDYGEAPGGVLAGPLGNGISMMVPLAGLAAFEAENVRDTPAADASTE